MKAGKIRTAMVMVAAMMISSALWAAPNSHATNCQPVSKTDGAIWGGTGGPLKSSSAPACGSTQITLSGNQTRSENGHELAYAFGKLLSGLKGSFEGAVWGGGGYVPPPK
jgi:hypothetical protein